MSHHRLFAALPALALALCLGSSPRALALEPTRVVFQNGQSIPISVITLQGDKLVVAAENPDFNLGQAFPLTSVDHIYGERPLSINQALALLFSNKPKEARDLLEPLYTAHRITAKFPGNFWVESARALLVCYAIIGDPKKCSDIGKEISDATPEQGVDSFVSLGKALTMSTSAGSADERMSALTGLLTDDQSASVRAYASYYCGLLLKEQKKDAEALDSFIFIPCIVPTGGQIITAAAELQSAAMLAEKGRREEALALAQSSLRNSAGTVIAEDAAKRIETLK